MSSNGSMVLCSLLILSTTGCGQQDTLAQTSLSGQPMSGGGDVHGAENAGETEPGNQLRMNRHVVRDARLAWKSEDRKGTVRHLRSVVSQVDGHVTRELETRHDHQVEYQLTVRVPSQHFETLVNDISTAVPHFDVRDISSRDVTSQFVDLDARLRAKVESEARCRELLQKADQVEELLKVEEQLGRLRAEIEALQGQMNVLSNQIEYSTLNIQIYEQINASSNFGGRIADNVRLGWLACVELTVAIVAAWPLIVVTLMSLLVWRRRNRKQATVGAS